MSEGPQFGRLISGGESVRDAIHIATISATAAEKVWPGQRVGLTHAGNVEFVDGGARPVGIVDPFLPAPVEKGQRFWLFLLPGTITGLRHVWKHPSFPDAEAAPSSADGPDPADVARLWLADFADQCGGDVTCEELIRMGMRAFGDEDDGWYYFNVGDREGLGCKLREHAAEFWKNWSIATGTTMPSDIGDKTSYRCSC